MAMSRLRGARSVTSSLPIEMRPPLTSSRPAIIRSRVDLPQPDGPTRTTNSPSTKDSGQLDELVTEGRPSSPKDYESLSTVELVELMNGEDARVPAAVAAISDRLAGVVDAVVAKLRGGGRLIYVGAGTSGALAAVDAGECESTFSTRPGQVVALVAGAGLVSGAARDAVEDDGGAGADAIRALGVSAD